MRKIVINYVNKVKLIYVKIKTALKYFVAYLNLVNNYLNNETGSKLQELSIVTDYFLKITLIIYNLQKL